MAVMTETLTASQVESQAESQLALDPEKHYEIVNGQPEEKEMAGAKHGGVGMRLGAEVWFHVRAHKLGCVYGPDTTFLIGGNDRLPGVAFVSATRIPAEGEPEGKWEIAPDLAVEVISPNDLYGRVEGKLWDYFAAGVRQVWLVSTARQTVTLYRSPTDSTVFTGDQELVSEDLLPGFRCRLGDIFSARPRA
jgi:Uma2 family endonuclease